MAQKSYFDLDWLCRSNDEVDEKLPNMAAQLLRKGVSCDLSNISTDVLMSFLDKELSSFADMTYDEVVYLLNRLIVACEVIVSLNELEREGRVQRTSAGEYFVSKKSTDKK